jgi:hypothetical protein
MRGLPRDLVAPSERIADLRPTQITVGMHEVEERRRRVRADGPDMRHLIPVILGPGKHAYVIDHHHLGLALLQEGRERVLTTVLADLHRLDRECFWGFLDARGWCHPYDAKGKRRDFDDIPKRLADLEDDPYRSLAGELRRAGGCAKDTTPFSEFLWAQFLRSRVKKSVIRDDFGTALTEALELAKSRDADYLPGWCGPHEG